MPYIPRDTRNSLDEGHFPPSTPGELNYKLTSVAEEYREEGGDSYETFNAIIGALEAAKLEFYRRVVVPYENLKREAHGDVYR